MTEVLVVIVIALIFAWAASRVRKRMKRGGGCCGEHEETEKKLAVKDRNKSHYPYQAELKIEGMTCENCARRVENALNSLPDTWAKVDIGSHRAKVRLKHPADQAVLFQTVREAGYIVSEYK